MAIKIQTEKPTIPVEIGKLRFEFDVSDESIKNFYEKSFETFKEIETIEVDEDEEEEVIFEKAKDILKKSFDLMLGEGAFVQIYELSPSIFILTNYYKQLYEGISKELEKMGFTESQVEKAKKYIKNKNKK